MNTACETSDLLVFSHLRWDLFFQRPHHLLTRFAKNRRVYYFEAPVIGMTDIPRLHIRETAEGVQVVVPYLPSSTKDADLETIMKELVDEVIFDEDMHRYTLWYYTLQAVPFTRHLSPVATIFDYISPASEEILNLESELFLKSDLVLTAGISLYEEKKTFHPNIIPAPSSIDYAHFSQSRLPLVEPDDQINIAHPRIGFYGVLDEKIDFLLLDRMAELSADFQFIILGQLEGIEQSLLPKRNNIHYLGKKDYHTLPLYIASWDCAMLPFLINESTRCLSPTCTSEFLAAGKPVVSTAISDVVLTYSKKNLVQIASSPEEFILKIESAQKIKAHDPEWLNKIDSFLADISWDKTFETIVKEESLIAKKTKIKEELKVQNPLIPASGVL